MTDRQPPPADETVIGDTTPIRPAPLATPEEGGILGWARAVALGVRDTAHDVMDEARKGSRKAYSDGWDKFEAKTKRRRKRG